jgi:MFS family permease
MPPAAARLVHARGIIGRHRHNKRMLERKASTRSRRALDWMNFFIADVQEGFGAFIAFYLATLGWLQESIGLVLTIGQVAAALALVPGGALVDAVRWKRLLVAAGLVMIAAAALIFA